MKVVNLVSQVFFLLITVLFLIYFLTGYDSAFEADQNCHSYLSSYDNPSGNYGCDHDTETHKWILYESNKSILIHICMGNYLGHHRIFNRFSSI